MIVARLLLILLAASLAMPTLAQDPPDFTESFFIKLPDDISKKDARALRTCSTRFASALVNTSAFLERNTPEIKEAVSDCIEGVGDPEFKRACELAVARSKVDLVIVLDVTTTSRGLLFEGRGLSPIRNGSIWTDSTLHPADDEPLIAAHDACDALGQSFLRVYAPDLTHNPPSLGGARLEILDVSPSPLSVSIDGRDLGLAPNQFKDLPSGNVTLTFSAPGYAPETRSLQLERDTMSVIRDIHLQPLPATLAIHSNIEGATIEIDGATRGTTAGDATVELELPAGPVNLRVARQGYAAHTERVVLTAGARAVIDVELRAVTRETSQCLESNELEACRVACEDGGDVDSCTLLGSMYAKGRGVTMDVPRAVELYERACDADGYAACNNLGFLYNHGKGVSQDLDRAHDLFIKACEQGDDLNGCNNLGYMYDYGQGVAQDHDRARSLFTRTCEAGSMGGCTNLGHMYQHARGVERDLSRAHDLYKAACDGGNTGGCNNLGYMYDNGVGVSEDAHTAATLYKAACDGGNSYACVNLANLYNNGKGVKYNPTKARSYLRKACQGGYQKACDALAHGP